MVEWCSGGGEGGEAVRVVIAFMIMVENMVMMVTVVVW